MLTVCTFFWGHKYGQDDVAKLATSVRRHLKQKHQFVVISAGYFENWPRDVHQLMLIDDDLTKVPGCFARLRMFDPAWIDYINRNHWITIDDRLVCMDLDTVITGNLDPLFIRQEPFLILQGANAVNPCPFNGSLMMLHPGAHPEVWNDFSLEAADKIPFHEFPDDQGWIWHKLPNAAGWKCGPESGVYSFQKTSWPKGEALPADARMVVFPGWRSPQKFKHLPWIKQHWTAHDRSSAGVPVHSSAAERL